MNIVSVDNEEQTAVNMQRGVQLLQSNSAHSQSGTLAPFCTCTVSLDSHHIKQQSFSQMPLFVAGASHLQKTQAANCI